MQTILGGILLAGALQAHDPFHGKEIHVAEEDFDASDLDERTPSKRIRKSNLDDIEFVSEADKVPVR